MKKVFFVVVGLLAVMAIWIYAADAAGAGSGNYTGNMTAGPDGKNRSVVVINTSTGDFEVFDIDNKGYDRKDNIEYYDGVSYNRETKTRIIYRYLIPGK